MMDHRMSEESNDQTKEPEAAPALAASASSTQSPSAPPGSGVSPTSPAETASPAQTTPSALASSLGNAPGAPIHVANPKAASRSISPVALVAIAIGFVFVFLGFARSSVKNVAGGDEPDDPPEKTSPVARTTTSATALPPLPMLTVTAQPIGARDRSSPLSILAALDGGGAAALASGVVPGGRTTARSGKAPDEGAEIDAARAALDKGDGAKALALLDIYDRDFGDRPGLLGIDARVLRIEALARKGDDAAALAQADDFFRDYPHSPKATRVRAIVDAVQARQKK